MTLTTMVLPGKRRGRAADDGRGVDVRGVRIWAQAYPERGLGQPNALLLENANTVPQFGFSLSGQQPRDLGRCPALTPRLFFFTASRCSSASVSPANGGGDGK
jgi:hypothetical protein